MPKKSKNNKSDEKVVKDDLQAKIEAAQAKDNAQNDQSSQENEAEIKIQQLTEALQRSMADMKNMTRRAEQDKMRFVKFANVELLKQLLPIIDNFNRACDQVPEDSKENSWTKGVVQIHSNFLKVLEKIGLKKIETVGKKLDTTKHEALMSGSGKKDIVIEEFEPGYSYHNEVIKPAKVKVGDGN